MGCKGASGLGKSYQIQEVFARYIGLGEQVFAQDEKIIFQWSCESVWHLWVDYYSPFLVLKSLDHVLVYLLSEKLHRENRLRHMLNPFGLQTDLDVQSYCGCQKGKKSLETSSKSSSTIVLY